MYDLNIIATNRGLQIHGVTRLSDTGLRGGDYSKALRMLEAGLSYTYTFAGRNFLIKAA